MIRSRLLAPPKAYLAIIAASLMSTWTFSRVPVPEMQDLAPAGDAQPSSTGTNGATGFLLFQTNGAVAADVLDRPLLVEGRRKRLAASDAISSPTTPPPDPSAQPPQGIHPAPTILFRGYMVMQNQPRALLIWGTDNMEGWYSVGDERDGWRISRIDDQSVTVESGPDEITINLYE